MSLKSIDKVTVLVAAATLMLKNSTTTTLEVKNELRKSGYNARQSEISDLMAQLGVEEKWDVNNSGSFKVYAPGSTAGIASVASPSGTSASTGTILSTKVSGCWEMNSTTSSTVVFVNGSLSREKARTAYMNQVTGTAWADTRGRRVK
jgi:hypothetical protein